MLRRALDQAVAQAAAMSSETNGMVDRRIMGKLLLTYFQRNHSKEVGVRGGRGAASGTGQSICRLVLVLHRASCCLQSDPVRLRQAVEP